MLCDQAGAGRTGHAVAAGIEEDAGWLVHADDACLIIGLVSRLAGCNCPGSCRCNGDQLLEDLLCSLHLILHLQKFASTMSAFRNPVAVDGFPVNTAMSCRCITMNSIAQMPRYPLNMRQASLL